MTTVTSSPFLRSTEAESEQEFDQGVREWVVRIFFPNVEEVFLSGEFNRWRVPGIAMEEVAPAIWETRVKLSNVELSKRVSIAGCYGFVRGRIGQVRYFPPPVVVTPSIAG